MTADEVAWAIGVGVFVSITASVLFHEYARAKERRLRRDDVLEYVDEWLSRIIGSAREIRAFFLGRGGTPNLLAFWKWHEDRVRREGAQRHAPTVPSPRWKQPSIESYVVQNADVVPAELRRDILRAVGLLHQMEIALSALRQIQLQTAHDVRPLRAELALVEAVVGEISSAVQCAETFLGIAGRLSEHKAMRKAKVAFDKPTKTPWDDATGGVPAYRGAEMPISEPGDLPKVGDSVSYKGSTGWVRIG